MTAMFSVMQPSPPELAAKMTGDHGCYLFGPVVDTVHSAFSIGAFHFISTSCDMPLKLSVYYARCAQFNWNAVSGWFTSLTNDWIVTSIYPQVHMR